MAVLFVSHSSKDDAAATALEAWLRDNGFTDIFVDHHSLAGGTKWREELRSAAGACRVVVCLVTESWLASDECFNEFRAAWYMGKRIIPLFLLPPMPSLDAEAAKRLAEVCAEDQGINLYPCVNSDQILDLAADESATNRLKIGLTRSRRHRSYRPRPGSIRDRPQAAIRRHSQASPHSATTMPTLRCSMAAAARSHRRWKSCARCAPNETCDRS